MLVIAGESIVVTSRSVDRPEVAHTSPSGAPAIAAWVAARLGTPTVFLSAVGDDEHGRLIVSALREAGVETSGLVVRVGRRTARADVEYQPDGSRRFDFAVADSAAPSLGADDLGEWPERAQWVHVSGSAVLFGDPMAAAIEQLVRRGRAAGATVSVDPNLRAELDDADARTRLSRLCRQAHVLFPSDDELRELGLDEDELVAAGVIVCATAAADGARLRRRDADEVAFPAVARPEQVVDPDGAGDTFAGATIAARLAGLGWEEAVRVAGVVVARAIGVPGAMTVDLSPDDLGCEPLIRTATRNDLAVLVALARAFYDEDGFATTDAALTRNLGVLLGAANAHLVLATVGGSISGFAVTTTAFILESGLVAELQDLYVAPSARSHGVGTALIEDAARWARSQSANLLEVVVAPNGQDVSHLHDYYRARGFVDEGRRLLARPLIS